MKKEIVKGKKTVKKELGEFKKFIMRGNVLDLAVGVIIGGAFGKIVTSLVNDVLMPLIGIVLGGLNFSDLSLTIKDAKIMYGSFLQNVLDFLIIALCVYIIVKLVNRFFDKVKKEKSEGSPKKITKTNEELLLEEIRDLLKEQKETPKKRGK